MGNLQRLSVTWETCCQKKKEAVFFPPACSKSNESVALQREEICRHLSKTLHCSCQRRQRFTARLQTTSVIPWHFDGKTPPQKISSFLWLAATLDGFTPIFCVILLQFTPERCTQHRCIKWIKLVGKHNACITKLITAFKDLLIEIVSPLGSSHEGKKENDFMIHRYPGWHVLQVKQYDFSL